MLMDRQTITVDIAPGSGPIQRIRLSQGDIGRPMGVYIIQNGLALDCSAYSAELYILKPDGKFYTTQATVDATETNLIKWETALQETPVAGACAAQIRITAGDDDIGTARFVEFVEASPCDMGSASESEVALLTEYVRQAHESAESAERDAETASGAASSASGSASTATTAANTATQAATAAAGSATAAAGSATAAAGSASTANTKAGEAAQSAANASGSATLAGEKATAASGSATLAGEKATAASDSADAAAGSASAAAAAKTAAETAQGKAEDAQAAAEAVLESIPEDYTELTNDVAGLKSALGTVPSGKTAQGQITDNANDIADLKSAINEDRLLFVSEIEDTVQTLTRDSSGAVTGMIHSRDGNVVRTDTYVKANGIFTETRTLANGKYITLVTDLSTKVTTISDVQEAA